MKLNMYYVNIQRVRVSLKLGWVTGNTYSSAMAYFQTFNLVVKRAHNFVVASLPHREGGLCERKYELLKINVTECSLNLQFFYSNISDPCSLEARQIIMSRWSFFFFSANRSGTDGCLMVIYLNVDRKRWRSKRIRGPSRIAKDTSPSARTQGVLIVFARWQIYSSKL